MRKPDHRAEGTGCCGTVKRPNEDMVLCIRRGRCVSPEDCRRCPEKNVREDGR